MTLLLQVSWVLPIILASASFCLASLDVAYEWKYIDYVWECNGQKAEAIEAGTYDYTKIITNDIQPLLDGRFLVTTPRYFDNPASLSTISDQTGEGGPLLAPYPDWTWHNRSDCSGITSVSRVFLDEYNRLWLVDSGKIGNEQVCPARILAFDATTDELLINVEIPEELSHNADDESQGRLEISIVETSEDSEDTFWVFISDLEGYGLLIWDGSDIWRLNADVFNPNPDAEIFSINGENITLQLGPSSLLITPKEYLESPALMFKPVSSVIAYAASLDDLHKSKSGSEVTFNQLNFTTPNQELARTFTKTKGIMIAGFTAGAIACWNIQNPLAEANIAYLDTNITNLQFVSSVKSTGSEIEEVWVMSNKLQQFALGTIDWTVSNYKILLGDVNTLVNGTVCEPWESYEVAAGIADKFFLPYETVDALYGIQPLPVQ